MLLSSSSPSSAPPPRSGPPHKSESIAAWQLIRDDVFDRILDDAALDRLVSEHSKTSVEPHADLMRLMLGMSLAEGEARTLFARVVEHRRQMSAALGRPIHIRVAALDLLTMRSSSASRKASRSSRPIMVAPALLERALEAAGSDGVTGLPRGPLFLNILQHELRQRRRRVAVAFIDLDGFKNVNDEHGHARGDEVLRTMAIAATDVLRRGDVLARVGGDEFALMLVDVSAEEASAAIGRLRTRFEELTAPLATSFSAGIAIAPTDRASEPFSEAMAEELLARADRAMYEEKRSRVASKR